MKILKLRGINKKLHFVGGTLSLVIVCVIVLTVIMNDRSKKDSLIINIAGKQSMLTQKMSKEIFYIKYRQNVDFRELNSAIDLFDNNIHDLIYGNSIKGMYPPQDNKIKLKLEEVDRLWIPFKSELQKVEKEIGLIKNDLETLASRTTLLLNEIDTVVKAMVKHNMNRELIDLFGMQRTLSQRMSLFIERYLRSGSKEDLLQFVKAKNKYDKTINKFINDKKMKAMPEIYTLLKKCNEYWHSHEKYLQGILEVEHSINDSILYVWEKNIKLLNTMDSAVWLYTEYSEEKNNMFIKFQYISLMVALIIILFSYILSREIVNHINDFVKRVKELEEDDINSLSHRHVKVDKKSEDELIEASNYLSKFVQKVNVTMNHLEGAIKQAESTSIELQNLANSVEDALDDLQIDEKEKENFDKKVNATEDIAIESTENLIHVRKMLEKLKLNLNAMLENSKKLD
ncbi:MAG: type IV pili methyl-accepting chemotaxis transducer N-terminal domain-containing protein [Sulfurospirillum sp.]|nr:type IV pili methyl-accepting chemotaxis transducer N-terminal domain-containing protein [Sulfurospirillum sp.]MBL0703330.1 type IV pili methyl-accepting chemotaxis transducer N-terminal domain-containing protein [Sulfurospirillum sp.]